MSLADSTIGKFDEGGSPCVEFNIHGVKHDHPGPKYTGIIDTGFTGFLQIPLSEAFSLGLPMEGTMRVSLADSTDRVLLTALAQVTFLDETKVGIVTLAPSTNEVLIGMDFLRQFRQTLMISEGIVFLHRDQGDGN